MRHSRGSRCGKTATEITDAASPGLGHLLSTDITMAKQVTGPPPAVPAPRTDGAWQHASPEAQWSPRPCSPRRER